MAKIGIYGSKKVLCTPQHQVFDKNGDWRDILKRQYTFKHQTPGGLTKNTYLMVETLDDPRREILTIDAVNMDSDNWVFGCKAKNSRLEILSNEEMEFEESATMVDRTQPTVCENGINLSQNSVIIPSNGKRKTITINLDQIRTNFTHIVVFMAKGMDQLRVSLDVYAARERNLEAKLPKWISFLFETRLVPLTIKEALYYNFSITGLDQPWQAYEIAASPIKCDTE